MIFEEPTVEYIELDMLQATTAVSGGDSPSGTDCQGQDSMGNNCSKYGSQVMVN